MPYSAMGSDLGDVNNDGLMDLFVADMAATTHQKDQRSVAVMRSFLQDPPEGSAAVPEYMRNALYVNTGTQVASSGRVPRRAAGHRTGPGRCASRTSTTTAGSTCSSRTG